VVQISLVLVSTVTVGAGGATFIDFTSIPQTGTDLLVVLSMRDVGTSFAGFPPLSIKINDYFTTYLFRRLEGTGNSVSSSSGNGRSAYGRIPDATTTSNTFGNTSLYFPNYTSSTFKSLSADSVSENNATAGSQQISAGLIQETNPITALQLQAWDGIAQHSTASLYIITKA